MSGFFHALLTIIHIVVCIFLSLVVLLQSGKGQDLASSFGGGTSQTIFGASGPANALSRATSIAAIVFMLTSLSLAIISTKARSIMDSAPIPAAVVATPVATPSTLPAEAPSSSATPQLAPAATPAR